MTTTPPPPPAAPPAPPAPPAPSAPQAPTATPVKKGLSPWAWVGIGCGCLLLLAVAVFGVLGFLATKKVQEVAERFEEDPTRATAELIVGFTPDLELVETTEDGKVTVRQPSSGEVMTLDLQDLQEGRFSFEGEDGAVTFDANSEDGGVLQVTTDDGTSTFQAGISAEDVPSWVPTYPGSDELTGAFHAVTPQGVTGMAAFTTADSVAEVMDYYREELTDDGFEIQNDTVSRTPAGTAGALSAKDDGGRSLTVGLQPSNDGGGTGVTLNYGEER